MSLSVSYLTNITRDRLTGSDFILFDLATLRLAPRLMVSLGIAAVPGIQERVATATPHSVLGVFLFGRGPGVPDAARVIRWASISAMWDKRPGVNPPFKSLINLIPDDARAVPAALILLPDNVFKDWCARERYALEALDGFRGCGK